jgi:hypothetical protein
MSRTTIPLAVLMEAFPTAIINATDDELWFFINWLNEERNGRGDSKLVPEEEERNG